MYGSPILDTLWITGLVILFAGAITMLFATRDRQRNTRAAVRRMIWSSWMFVLGMALWDVAVLFSSTVVGGKVAVTVVWVALVLLVAFANRRWIRRVRTLES